MNSRRYIDRMLNTLGRPGVIAVGIGVFAVLFYLQTVAPARQKLNALQTRAAQLHAQLPKAAAPRAATEDTKARIDSYFGSFPAVEELPAAIALTLETAKAHSLAIDKADYSHEPSRKDDLTALQMSFTLKGPYPKLRNFLMDLLQTHPAMALDDVSFRRDDIASTEIEAKVRLTFFVTGVPWNRPSAAAG